MYAMALPLTAGMALAWALSGCVAEPLHDDAVAGDCRSGEPPRDHVRVLLEGEFYPDEEGFDGERRWSDFEAWLGTQRDQNFSRHRADAEGCVLVPIPRPGSFSVYAGAGWEGYCGYYALEDFTHERGDRHEISLRVQYACS